jgi:hypothetical protein
MAQNGRFRGRRDLGLGPALTPLSRAGLALIALRWRHEFAMAGAIAAAISASVYWAGHGQTTTVLVALATAAGLTSVAATRPEVRQIVAARAWCIITPHRVRTCFAQAWIYNRAGQVPAVLRARAMPFGERVLVWCRAGTSFEDIESACELLAAACWAIDVTATRSSRYAQVVYVDVIRRPVEHAATEAGDDNNRQDAA